MKTEGEILTFFREAISPLATISFRKVPLELDTVLQDYAEEDELIDAISKFSEVCGVDLSSLDLQHYFPWKTQWFFRKWSGRKEPDHNGKKVLTVNMFVHSAKNGKWLYQ